MTLPKQQSFFLFGARGVGKSWLIHQHFPAATTLFVNLLDPLEYESLSLAPASLRQRIEQLPSATRWIVIDEIQKIPALLDTVHLLLASRKHRFALTGSSARKLKRGGANLLAGRAHEYQLFPLTAHELGKRFVLRDALEWGGLPDAILTRDHAARARFLRTYTHTYLQEEIAQEQIVRRLDPFRRFLAVAAQANGTIVNYTKIAQDVGVSPLTVQAYFEILEDTLIGFSLPPYHRSIRKRQRCNPKFYLFDLGIQRALANTLTVPLEPQTYAFGRAFEHFVLLEIFRHQRYQERDYQLAYLRTKDDAEIDLIIERPGQPIALVEIKSTTRVTDADVRTLARFVPDFRPCKAYCLSLDPHPKRIGAIHALPWQQGLTALGL